MRAVVEWVAGLLVITVIVPWVVGVATLLRLAYPVVFRDGES